MTVVDDRRGPPWLRRRACGPARRSSPASPASGWRRPPSTTSPARPGAPGPRSTATSTASPRSCAARSPSSSSASTGVAVDAGAPTSRRSPTRSSRSSSPPRASCVDHDALQFLLAHEPERCSATSRSAPATVVLVARRRRARARVRPLARRPTTRTRAGDWLARVLRSYVLMPNRPIDLTDPVAARDVPRRSS